MGAMRETGRAAMSSMPSVPVSQAPVCRCLLPQGCAMDIAWIPVLLRVFF
jgi:hypothetical protein